MKVALLYPCVGALCEKMAALFPGLIVIGPPCDDLQKWPKEILPLAKAIGRQAEWKEVGLDLHFEEKPYSECDFSKFDLLIESVETFNYAADWRNHCTRVECPIIVTTCWTDSPSHLPPAYLERIKNFPMIVQMPAQLPAWKNSILTDVSVALVPVGDWWFEKEWTGSNGKGLFVLAGKDLWRPADKAVCGVDLWEQLSERFPGKMLHHDGAVDFKTAKQMGELFSESRVFINLDNENARALTTTFTEALAAGMPVVARDFPSLSYKDFIITGVNGSCTNDFNEMCFFIKRCLEDAEFARRCGKYSREIARISFSVEAIRPLYEAAAQRAKEAALRHRYREGTWPPQ